MINLLSWPSTLVQTSIRIFLKILIHLYRLLLSPLLGVNCRYHPSCSAYALEALDRHGLRRGSWLAAARLARCHPWGGHGVDPVPDTKQSSTPFLK